MMHIDVLTIFPEMFSGVLGHSMLKRAGDTGAVHYNVVNFRVRRDDRQAADLTLKSHFCLPQSTLDSRP